MEKLSPILKTRLEQQQLNQVNNVYPMQTKVDIGGAKLEQLSADKFDYLADDGKISLGNKITSFAKGLISPITALFSSPRNFLIGAGMIAGGAALTIATGGAIAPLFVVLGVVGGGIQLGRSIHKASTATTDDEAKQAYQGVGAGISAVGLSVLGSKAALKGAGVDTKDIGFLRATIECFKQVPSSISKSVGAFTSGQALTNIRNVFKPEKLDNAETQKKPETASEPKPETDNAANKPKPEAPETASREKPIEEIPDDYNQQAKNNNKSAAGFEESEGIKSKQQGKTAKEPQQYNDGMTKAENMAAGSEQKLQQDNSAQAGVNGQQATSEPAITESKADIKTAQQALDEAKARFFENKRKEIPSSYEERYRIVTNGKQPEHRAEIKYAMRTATEDDRYLDFLWKRTGEYRELELAATLEKFSKEQLEVFNSAKAVLDSKGLQYDPRELADLNENFLKCIAEGKFSTRTTVYGHAVANDINPYLRRDEDGGIIQLILDEGFKTVEPTAKSETVYRAVGSSNQNKLNYEFMKKLLNLQEGETFTDSGYSYSSYNSDRAVVCSSRGHGSDALKAKLIIDVPEGARVSQAKLAAQEECLFPRNATFKVKTPYNPETGEIFVEYILPQ